MAGIIEEALWEPAVREVGTGEPVSGGKTGTVNYSLQDLANRTLWLKNRLEETQKNCLYSGKNLSDVADPSEARKNLGLSTAKEILQTIYPVGALYISANSTSPADLFGFGSWESVGGRFLLGADDEHAAGTTGGEERHVITAEELPAHAHEAFSSQNGSHGHASSAAENGSHAHTVTIGQGGGHAHSGSTASAGNHQHQTYGGNYTANEHPIWGIADGAENHLGFFRMDYANQIWYTAEEGSHSHSFTTGSAGAHSHAVSASQNGSHSHSLTIEKDGAHSHSITVKETGAGRAVSLLPPYLSVHIWRRNA